MDQLLSCIEAATSNLQQNCFEMSLPLSLCNSLCVLHYLASSHGLTSHLKVLRILKHGHGHLFGWNLVAASLYNLTSALVFTETELNPCCNEPDFPLYIVRAALNRVSKVTDSFFIFTHTIIGLCYFDIYLPVKLFGNILEHFIEDCLKGLKFFLTGLFVKLFIKTKVLEPQRAIFGIKVKALFTES